MTALGDARTAVAGALAGVGVPVHDQPPGALQPPCVVLLPGSPWIAPRGHVTLEVVAYTNQASGNSTALTRLEELVEAVRNAIWAHGGIGLGDTDQPVADADSGTLSAATPVVHRTNCH